MALVNMAELFAKADHADYAVGAFNVTNLETTMGLIKAAEAMRSPVIMQIAEARLRYSPLALIGPVMVAAAREAAVPVAVHLDHGLTLETVKQALDLGFTSVMFDGSRLPLQENVAKTREVVRLAKACGAATEGEIGRVGGSEGGSGELEMMATSVEGAKLFAELTGVDALAVAIGNAHGVYQSAPHLMFDRLSEIDEVVQVPLVLHGGTGISVGDFQECIRRGIKKINVATATFNNVVTEVRQLFRENPEADYYTYHQRVIDAACDNIRRHIEAFRSAGQA